MPPRSRNFVSLRNLSTPAELCGGENYPATPENCPESQGCIIRRATSPNALRPHSATCAVPSGSRSVSVPWNNYQQEAAKWATAWKAPVDDVLKGATFRRSTREGKKVRTVSRRNATQFEKFLGSLGVSTPATAGESKRTQPQSTGPLPEAVKQEIEQKVVANVLAGKESLANVASSLAVSNIPAKDAADILTNIEIDLESAELPSPPSPPLSPTGGEVVPMQTGSTNAYDEYDGHRSFRGSYRRNHW